MMSAKEVCSRGRKVSEVISNSGMAFHLSFLLLGLVERFLTLGPCRTECACYRAKAGQSCFDVFDDLVGEDFGFGEVVEVGEGVVLEPEYIEAGFVTAGEFFVGVFAPTASGFFSASQVGLRLWRLPGR